MARCWLPCLVVVALLIVTTGAVTAECVINKPKPYVQAIMEQPEDGNPDIECLPPPNSPCTKPEAPSIVGSVLTEEVTLQAAIPPGYPAVTSWWQIEEQVAGVPVVYYETQSKEAVAERVGSTVKIGLPGLRAGTSHSVRVGFCRDISGFPGLKGCNCWSDPVTVVTRSTFESMTPDSGPRSNMTLKVEDQFERPATSPQSTPNEGGEGDGVGPNAVWLDGYDGPAPDNSRISADGHAAVLANGMIRYVAPAKHTDSFAMVKFNVTDGTGADSTSYNIEVAGRHVGNGATSQFYVAKLTFNQLNFTDFPALLVLDETQFSPTGGLISPVVEGVDFIKLTKSGTVATCPGETEDRCTELPPLTSASGTAILQISTWKDEDYSQTVITGAVGWNCPETNGTTVYDCTFVCCLEKRDNAAGKLDVAGQWWILGHHTDVKHRLHWFRAGDASTGYWP